MIFRKSLKFHRFGLVRVIQGAWALVARVEAWGVREVMVSAPGDAVGVPETRNTPGMLLVLSLLVCTVFGGPYSDL